MFDISDCSHLNGIVTQVDTFMEVVNLEWLWAKSRQLIQLRFYVIGNVREPIQYTRYTQIDVFTNPWCTWGMTTCTSRWQGGSSQSPAPTAECQTWCCKSASVSQCTSGPRTWRRIQTFNQIFFKRYLSTWPVLPQPHGLEFRESFQACSKTWLRKQKTLVFQTCCLSRCLGRGWRIPAWWSTGWGPRPSPFVRGRPSWDALMSCEPWTIHSYHCHHWAVIPGQRVPRSACCPRSTPGSWPRPGWLSNTRSGTAPTGAPRAAPGQCLGQHGLGSGETHHIWKKWWTIFWYCYHGWDA